MTTSLTELPGAGLLDVESRRIEDVAEYPGNPRKHTKRGVAAIARSITKLGWRQPIVVDVQGVIIIGHGRYRAAVQLGLDEVPVHVARGLSEDQARALRLADNRVGEHSSWDEAGISSELGLLRDAGYTGLEALGFGADFLDKLGAGKLLAEPASLLPAHTDVQPGDVHEVGAGSRVVCGDALDAEVRGIALGDARPHLCVTDPPSGVKYDPAWRLELPGKSSAESFADDRPITAYVDAVVESVHVLYIWHATTTRVALEARLAELKWQIRAELVWVKPGFIIGRGHFRWAHEPCLYAVRKGRASHWTGARKAVTVARADWEDETVIAAVETMLRSGHTTQKPLELMARPIRYSSEVGDWVWEPFAGSGSTILAAEREHRRCAAVELAPVYVEVIRRRAAEAGLAWRRASS